MAAAILGFTGSSNTHPRRCRMMPYVDISDLAKMSQTIPEIPGCLDILMVAPTQSSDLLE